MNFELTDFYPMYPYINDDEISYDAVWYCLLIQN